MIDLEEYRSARQFHGTDPEVADTGLEWHSERPWAADTFRHVLGRAAVGGYS